MALPEVGRASLIHTIAVGVYGGSVAIYLLVMLRPRPDLSGPYFYDPPYAEWCMAVLLMFMAWAYMPWIGLRRGPKAVVVALSTVAGVGVVSMVSSSSDGLRDTVQIQRVMAPIMVTLFPMFAATIAEGWIHSWRRDDES